MVTSAVVASVVVASAVVDGCLLETVLVMVNGGDVSGLRVLDVLRREGGASEQASNEGDLLESSRGAQSVVPHPKDSGPYPKCLL